MFTISSGSPLVKPNLMPTNYIMVNRDMSLWFPGDPGFTNVVVRGLIVSDYPRVTTPGKIIVGDTPGESWGWPYVIRVNKVEQHHAADASQPFGSVTIRSLSAAGSHR
jgi:hypothetical protein